MLVSLLCEFQDAVADRDCLKVYLIGKKLIDEKLDITDSRNYNVINEILMAAVSLGDLPVVKKVYAELHGKYPSSKALDRVAAQIAPSLNSKDGLESAIQMCQYGIGREPTDLTERRILLALLRLSKEVSVDIDGKLQGHLADVPTDVPSWRELGILLMRRGKLLEAQLVYEELALVLDTASVYNLVTLADICAQRDSLTAAMKYYCLALTHESRHPRALWGIVTTYERMTERREWYEEKIASCFALREQAIAALKNTYSSTLRMSSLSSDREAWLLAQIRLCEKLSST